MEGAFVCVWAKECEDKKKLDGDVGEIASSESESWQEKRRVLQLMYFRDF